MAFLRVMKNAAILLMFSELCIGINAEEQQAEISRNCGGMLTNTSGTIASPMDPATNEYSANQDCTWNIPKQSGRRIRLQVDKFSLEEPSSTNSCNDFVSINYHEYCGRSVNHGQIGGPYDYGVSIVFHSNHMYQASGFEIRYTQERIPVCEPECTNNGECIADNVCRCADGYFGFVCSYQLPRQSDIILLSSDPGIPTGSTCVIFGHKNIRTFDGSRHHVDGSCEYALAEFEDIKITVAMHDPANRSQHAIRTISITKGQVQTIRLIDGPNGKKVAETGDGRVLKLPEFYGPYEVVSLYRRIRVKDDYFVLEFDEDGSAASLLVDPSYKGRTRGLCGNYNGNPGDDMQTASGNTASDDDMFQMSWSQDTSCTATTANIDSGENAEEVRQVCKKIQTAGFDPCLRELSTEIYMQACMKDMVLCDYMNRADCECSSFTQYARDCIRMSNVTDLSWRIGICEKQCPSNQIYSECAPYCPRTCKSLGTTYQCPNICIDGCTCAEGLYWDGNRCVHPANCSCHVGDIVYASGETVTEQCRQCTCSHGQLVCQDTPCDGTAIVFGNPHYLTLDGVWYTYDGVCEYTLLRLADTLRVTVDTENCGKESAYTCIGRVTITSGYFSKVQLLTNGDVTVADEEVEFPYIIYNTLEIRQLTSLYISVYIVSSHVWIKWNSDGIVIFGVPQNLQDQTRGMLGNFNGETRDEYKTSSGIVERTVNAFAESWKTDPNCNDFPTIGMGDCVLQDSDREICQNAVYHHEPFSGCLASTNHEDVIRRYCQEAICASQSETEKRENICDALSVFATLCAIKGHVSYWRNETFCTVTCSNGKEYEPWTSSCGRTCRGITEHEVCSDSLKAEGCVCPEGMYEDRDGDCVERSECGCFSGGRWHNNNELFQNSGQDCMCEGGVVSCSGSQETNCTGDMVYTGCTGGAKGGNCHPTCGNKVPECGQDCQPGCTCPNGTYFESGRCISGDQCPCTFEQTQYRSGESVIDDCDHCICNEGEWSCQRTTMCSRTCSVVSGSYFKTFDEGHFSSRGTCNYKLMSDACGDTTDGLNFFEIHIKSHPCEGSDYTMCNLTLNARFGNDIYAITRGQDIVHTSLSSPRYQYYDVIVKYMKLGFSHVIEADFPGYYIQLSYDTKTSVNIEVSKNLTTYRQICGLCGNLDDSATNDFTTKNGETDSANFVNSMRLDATCAEVSADQENSCHGKAQAEENARQKCKIIKSILFKACNLKIDPAPFFETCVEQTCSCDTGGDCECYCSSVAAYADACGRQGAKVNWRPVTSCPVECEEFTDPSGDLCDIKYDPCQTCVQTCCAKCTRGCFEGCFPTCDEGMVYDPNNQTCIPKDNCVCPAPPTSIVTTHGATTTAIASSFAETMGATTTAITSSFAETTRGATTKEITSSAETTRGATTTEITSSAETTSGPTTTETTSSAATTTASVPTASTAAEQTTTAHILTETTRPCDYFCTYIDNNNLSLRKQVGESWDVGCFRSTCRKDVSGCAYTTETKIQCTDTTTCEDYEQKVVKDNSNCCTVYGCECEKCTYQGVAYNVSQTWIVDDCITMECQGGFCPNATQLRDERDHCAAPPSCPQYQSVITDDNDPCCSDYSCACNATLCPAELNCLGGSRIDWAASDECCNITECLPVCSYEGREYKNGSQVAQHTCFDEYCRCTERTCSIYEENRVQCPFSPECTNTDISHSPSIISEDGCCRTNYCECQCKVYGDPHYTTFDGKHYPFQGVCHYVLVTYRDSDDLQIISDNENCFPNLDDVSCLREIIVIWKGTTIVLGVGNTVTLDGSLVPSSDLPLAANGIRVKKRKSGELILIIDEISLSLSFESQGETAFTFINVPMTSWFNRTLGLCGTCSNTQDDDFETIHGNKTGHTDDFASSWVYNATDKECLPCNPPDHKACWNCTDPRHGNDIPSECTKCTNNDECSTLKSDIFSNCSIDVEPYYNSCVFDHEAMRKCSLCSSTTAMAYSKACGCVKWRTEVNCNDTCPVGQIYKECVPGCELETTCDNREAMECGEPDQNGCGCPEGMLLRHSNSTECIERKCCSCSDPTCKDYETLTLLEGQDPTDCCAIKKCVCTEVENPPCELPKVLNETDLGTPGCFRNECICPENPECPLVNRDCNSPGCAKNNHYGDCGCLENITCTCDASNCPDSISCEPCEELELTSPESNPDIACGGTCCPQQSCRPSTCPEVPATPVPQYPTASCPFIQHIQSNYSVADTNQCCPRSYDIECRRNFCGVIPSPTTCDEGYEPITITVDLSKNATIRDFMNCPKVNDCCVYNECTCKSCPYNGRRLRLGESTYSIDGCTKVSCDDSSPQGDGCYAVTEQTPTCPTSPECGCHQILKTIDAPRGATNSSQWAKLCCAEETCQNRSCSNTYQPGPTHCPYPQERIITYETVNGCPMPNCPVAECTCSLCVDSNNVTHAIGTTYQGADHCENVTCLSDTQHLCPQGSVDRVPCSLLTCNATYQVLNSTQPPQDCCPIQSCHCKPYSELQNACENWKTDTSTCQDQVNMNLVEQTGLYQDHVCCPEKKCVCIDPGERKCPKWTDYQCPHAYQDRVETESISDTNCCPDYKCVCNCSHVQCPYASWTFQSEGEDCSCNCTCDRTLCHTNIPTCGTHEDLVETGTRDGGCCPIYECVCNTTTCPALPAADCNKYQISYKQKSSDEDCCYQKNSCRCNPDTTLLTQLCNETRNTLPMNCSEGWESYVQVMAAQNEGMCCEIQCRCVSCTRPDTGEIVNVGESWETVEDCQNILYVCSNEKLPNTCHRITSNATDVMCTYNSPLTYEAVKCPINSYAVEILPQTGCCPAYQCENCSSTTRTCSSSTETMLNNATHPRCPSECICKSPLPHTELTSCYKTASCGLFEKAVPVGEIVTGMHHSDKCCPDYICVCDECPSGTIHESSVVVNASLCEKVGVHPSDVNQTCCKDYQVQCEEPCSCPQPELDCTTTEACSENSAVYSDCHCKIGVTCECRPENCPTATCGLCEELRSTTQLPNPAAACGGTCCPVQECVPRTCPKIEDISVPTHCDFIRKVNRYSSNDNCCPISKEVVCNGTCPSGFVPENSCADGYKLVDIRVANSSNPEIRAFDDCPKVDECCPHRICVCDSCSYAYGIISLGDPPVFSPDGCTQFSCNRGTKMENGCYERSVLTPECPSPSGCPCDQNVVTTPARRGASNMNEWPDLCCPKYSCEVIPCSSNYQPGPNTCQYPAVREVTYEPITVGCENMNCPIATCQCDKCLDENNATHAIGTIYPGADPCENFTCLANDGELCPRGQIYRDQCPPSQCDTAYEYRTEETPPGYCCPVETCSCKPDNVLQTICIGWKNNTEHCPDPDHMKLEKVGSTNQHHCCPDKICKCKDEEIRYCEKGEDYQCPGNYTTVKTVAVTIDNCCPDFQCTCDCSGMQCQWSTWTPKTSNGTCNCRCSCDPSQCLPPPTCSDNRTPMKVGEADGGCCPVYDCVCNKTTCPQKEVLECSPFEDKVLVYKHSEDCCPDDECRCKNTSALANLNCVETCPVGYNETFQDPRTRCCKQCVCNHCYGSTGITQVGFHWNVTENNCIVTKICSEDKVAGGCHIIKDAYSERDNCIDREGYETLMCDSTEEATTLSTMYQCCPRFRCECTTNATVLERLCTQYNGATCSKYKKSVYSGTPECCPTYQCVCNEDACEYTCSVGFVAQKSTVRDASTENCCFNYTCVCDSCLMGDDRVGIGYSRDETLYAGCRITRTCEKNDNQCVVRVYDPRRDCQSLEQYQADICRTPYQKAVATSTYMENNLCCTKYVCVCNNTAENCPSAIEVATCTPSEYPVQQGKMPDTADCCDDYTCQCRNSGDLSNICSHPENYTCPGDGYITERVPSTDNCCPNFTCNCNPNTCSNFNHTCDKGYERYDMGGTSACCPNYGCRCNACVVDGMERPVNSTWQEDSCNILACTLAEGESCPSVTSSKKYTCEPVDVNDCENRGGILRGIEETDGCCKECTLCKRVERLQNLTKTVNGAICRSVEPFDVGGCEGACPQVVDLDPLTGLPNEVCACCEPTIGNRSVLMTCEGRNPIANVNFPSAISCKCTGEP